MIESEASVVVNKRATDIFKFIVDVDNIPIWVNGAHVIKITKGPVGPDYLFREGNVLLVVTDLQVNRRLETESVRVQFPTRLFLSYSHGVMSFEPADHGTKLTFQHQIEVPALVRPFARMVTRKAQKDTETALQRLRSVLEALSP